MADNISYSGKGGPAPWDPTKLHQQHLREREEAARRFPPGTKVWVEAAQAVGVVLGLERQRNLSPSDYYVVVVALPSGYTEDVPCDKALAGGLEVR
jgi:hypothetical protein